MSKSTKKQQINQNDQSIIGFEGYYSFLSNDYPSWIIYQSIRYPSATTAFQAARTDNIGIRQQISSVSDVEQFSKIAMSIKNPSNWNQVKQKIMENIVRDKFKRNKQIMEKLLATKNRNIVNIMKNGGFNEQYWGVFEGRGKNTLGKLIMKVRQQLIKGVDTIRWIQNNLSLQLDKKMLSKLKLSVLKQGKKIQQLTLGIQKNYYLFGSLKSVDIYLQNPMISRNHACIYFDSNIQVLIVDLYSTHKTFIKRNSSNNKIQLQPLVSYRLYQNDVIMFGTSNREYVVDIDRTQIQKYIAEQENNIKQNSQHIPKNLQNYDELSSKQIKSMLGLQKKCILIQGLKQSDNYNKIKTQFNKIQKIKNIKFKIDYKTGKNLGIAVVYVDTMAGINNIVNKRQQLEYRIKVISQSQAEKILNNYNSKNGKYQIDGSKEKQREDEMERSRDKYRNQKRKLDK